MPKGPSNSSGFGTPGTQQTVQKQAAGQSINPNMPLGRQVAKMAANPYFQKVTGGGGGGGGGKKVVTQARPAPASTGYAMLAGMPHEQLLAMNRATGISNLTKLAQGRKRVPLSPPGHVQHDHLEGAAPMSAGMAGAGGINPRTGRSYGTAEEAVAAAAAGAARSISGMEEMGYPDPREEPAAGSIPQWIQDLRDAKVEWPSGEGPPKRAPAAPATTGAPVQTKGWTDLYKDYSAAGSPGPGFNAWLKANGWVATEDAFGNQVWVQAGDLDAYEQQKGAGISSYEVGEPGEAGEVGEVGEPGRYGTTSDVYGQTGAASPLESATARIDSAMASQAEMEGLAEDLGFQQEQYDEANAMIDQQAEGLFQQAKSGMDRQFAMMGMFGSGNHIVANNALLTQVMQGLQEQKLSLVQGHMAQIEKDFQEFATLSLSGAELAMKLWETDQNMALEILKTNITGLQALDEVTLGPLMDLLQTFEGMSDEIKLQYGATLAEITSKFTNCVMKHGLGASVCQTFQLDAVNSLNDLLKQEAGG